MKFGGDQDGNTKVEDMDKLGQTNIIVYASAKFYIFSLSQR